MRQTSQPISTPFEQTRRLKGIQHPLRKIRPRMTRRLRPDQERVMADLLTNRVDFIDSPAFHEDDAESQIYAKVITKPDVSWYQPLMDRLTRSPSQSVSSGQITRLTSKQERILFHQYNYAKYRMRNIQIELGMIDENKATTQPSDEQIRELLYWHKKVEDLRQQITESNVGLVIAMARRTRIRDLEFADLVSEGNMALLRSAEKFNADYGFKFSTYACQSILKAFSRLGIKASRYRERFPVEFEPELETAMPNDSRREELDSDCADELLSIVEENRCGLTDVEMSVILHRFGLGQDDLEGNLTLGQVGQIVGVGKERVRQIQVKALAKLRTELEMRFLERTDAKKSASTHGREVRQRRKVSKRA